MHSLSASVFICLCAVSACVLADDSSTITKRSTTQRTTTENVKTECAALNSSCDTCITSSSCAWCPSKPPSCLPHPGGVIPPSSFCPLSDLRWGTCWVNYEALLIAFGVIAGILLISITICACCCYRRCQQRCRARRETREETISNAEFQERRARNDARRAERQVKYDEIRRKYGLTNDDGASSAAPYTRFDNEAWDAFSSLAAAGSCTEKRHVVICNTSLIVCVLDYFLFDSVIGCRIQMIWPLIIFALFIWCW